MKILFATLLLFTFNSSYAFQSGVYRGESPDGSQVCDFEIEQKVKSHIIQYAFCEDMNEGRNISSEAKEWRFGKTTKYIMAQKMTMTVEVAQNLHRMNYSNKKRTESYDKEITAKDHKTIHYKFSVTEEGNTSVWFDLDLQLVEQL